MDNAYDLKNYSKRLVFSIYVHYFDPSVYIYSFGVNFKVPKKFELVRIKKLIHHALQALAKY